MSQKAQTVQAEKKIGKTDQPDLRIYRIASLILANAMLFQEIISQTESGVKTIQQTLQSPNLSLEFANQWKYIEDNIDFIPIFNVSRELLLRLPSSPETERALRELAGTSIQLLANRAALRHDLMGRIFHKLLADAKFFGAFYTKIPAATLLLKLTIDDYDSHIDWLNPESVGELKIGDLACGTGTLPKAALGAVDDRHIAESAKHGVLPKSDEVHRLLVENGLWGFDVLPSAVHLAAASVAMHNPRVRVGRMHFYSVPLGGKAISAQLGSIEFAKGRKLHAQQRLIGASIGALNSTGTGEEPDVFSLPMLDICTMNPPFTRSVNSNLLFGGVGEKERAELQAKLGDLVRQKGLSANITAGLGSVFFAIGLGVTRTNGMLAFVLPKNCLNGDAWGPTQTLFGRHDVRYVISSHEPKNWNFSESTKLSEVLLVMRKVEARTKDARTTFINLWRQPRTAIEAITLVSTIRNGLAAKLEDNMGTCELRSDGNKFGEMISLNLSENQSTSLAIPAAFAQTDLARSAYNLSKGEIFYPGQGQVGSASLVRLDSMTQLGPDGRDIYDGFSLSTSQSPYPALWGYDKDAVSKLTEHSNQYLAPRTRAMAGRHRRDAQLLWSRAGTLMLPKELRLNTNRLAAIVLPHRALSNVWWPTRWRTGNEEERKHRERELALWFNSTLGLFTLLMQRQETEGPWCKFPKAWWEELPTLDITKLSQPDHERLSKLWGDVSKEELQPINKLSTDPVRKKIDAVFEKILKIPPLDEFRILLNREPLITAPAE